MGYELYREVKKWAPETLTHREKLTAMILADDANEATRLTWSSVIDPEIMRQAMIKTERDMRKVLARLVDEKVLEHVGGGHNGKVAKYRLLPLEPAGSPEVAGPKKTSYSDGGDGEGFQKEPATDGVGGLFRNRRRSKKDLPTPFSSSTTSPLSSPPSSSTPQPPAPPKERENPAAPSNDNGPAAVAAAWSAARDGRRNPAAERDIAASALQLLDAGWPLADVTALAEDMARRQPTYRDLTRHADHWQPARPAAGAAPELPPWCGACDGEPLAERWISVADGVARCPDCNPHARAA
jgi:hypothetical protein